MTFSLVACDELGQFGAVVSSSSPAVGARCLALRDAVGATSTQNITDPRLGPSVLDLLATGFSAREAIDAVVESDSTSPYRQLVAIDRFGQSAVHSGIHCLGVVGSSTTGGAASAGNMLGSEDVPLAMISAFSSAGGSLEEKLLAALRGGLDAGGEEGPIHSAAMSVVANVGWRVTDLRVDWDEEPVKRMRELVELWLPQRDDYVHRGLNPSSAPSYKNVGDERRQG